MAPRNNHMHSTRRVIDVSSVMFTLALLLLAMFAPWRVHNAGELVPQLAVAVALYAASIWLVRRMPDGFPAFLVSLVALNLLYSLLFRTSTMLQLVLSAGWHDDVVIPVDTAILGSETSVWLQRFVTPALTEWMMFAYVLYIPMLPVLGVMLWWKAGEAAGYEYLVNFVLVNLVCYVGFLLFPVQTPMWHHPEQFTVPLTGGFFTQCGEWVRQNLHEQGGGLPSPHCALGTVMMLMVARHWKRALPVALPLVMTVYAATVYCRYHYVWDMITGVAAAVVVVRWSPALVSLTERASMPSGARLAAAPQLFFHPIKSREELL